MSLALPGRLMTALLIAITLCWSSGCATLAHRNDSGQRMRTSAACEGHGEVCPWLAGDAAWLLAGVVPGVVAFVVDFSTGAWKHAPDQTPVMTASERVEPRGSLLFSDNAVND